MNPSPKITQLLSSFDYAIFIIITLSTFLFIIWGHLKKKKLQSESESFLDLMLMGRSLTLPVFVATLVATWYGGIFGVSQIAFEHGIFNFVTQGVFWYLSYLIFAFFIIKKIKNFKAMTLPHLIGQMFGPKSEKLSAFFNILNLIPIVYTISLGLLLKMLLGFSLEISIVIGVLFVLSYSFLGGLRSVVYSDILQFFVMITSIVLVLIFSITTFGFEILKTLPSTHWEPLGTFTITETLVWGFIALSTLVDPNFYQRCFAAKDFKTAKKGILLSTCIWIIFDLCLTTGAMYARAVIPEASSHDGYFIYALQLLPHGLRGFFLAGICATILSTLDSYIFLAASTLSFDLAPKRFKGKIKTHYFGVIVIAVFSVIMACIFEGNIKDVWKSLGSISSAAILVPVLLGYIFKDRFSDNAFVISSCLGASATVYWRLSGMKSDFQLDEIYIGMLCSSFGMFVIPLWEKRSLKRLS